MMMSKEENAVGVERRSPPTPTEFSYDIVTFLAVIVTKRRVY